MSQSTINIEHVHLLADKPFDKFIASFEKQLGHFDPIAYEELKSGSDPQAVRARLESMAGPSGFMLFNTSNHGLLLRLVDRPRKAIQYVLGNPLFAIEMTRHAIGAALYAPLRLLVYEPEEGKTCVEYDLPSSLFGQFGDECVDRIAKSLEPKTGSNDWSSVMNNVSVTYIQTNDKLEQLSADLASSVYQVALRATTPESWLELELGLWQAISNRLAAHDTDSR